MKKIISRCVFISGWLLAMVIWLDPFSRNGRAFNMSVEYPIRQCSQQERLTHVKRYCNLSFFASKPPRDKPEIRSMISTQDKYLLCWMSKAGCTALKTVILESKGFDATHDSNRSNLNQAHGVKTFIKYGFQYLHEINKEKRRGIVDSYYNMIAIRHPFDRIVSYYRDKIIDTDIGSAHPDRVAEILRFSRPHLFLDNTSALSQMEYPQAVLGQPSFVEFMTWMHERRIMDEHWNLILDACHPCAHHWDAILRMETIATDGKILLEKIKSDRDAIPVRHTHQEAVQQSYFNKHLPQYGELGDDVIAYLVNTYRLDMDMFGYGWNSDTNTAYCKIDSVNGPCC